MCFVIVYRLSGIGVLLLHRFKVPIHKIPSTNSNIAKRKALSIDIIYKKKNTESNGIAHLPGSYIVIGFRLIKCIFSCFLNTPFQLTASFWKVLKIS